MAKLTHERLREMVAYSPETGLFSCLMARKNRAVGDIEDRIAGPGYVAFCLDGRQYYAHRLAWFYMHGEWPAGEVDHINRDKTDNRLANLRVATRSQNSANIGARSDNRSGFKGVFPNKRRWSSQVIARGKTYHLGTFDTPEMAHEAYCHAARRLHGEFARTS